MLMDCKQMVVVRSSTESGFFTESSIVSVRAIIFAFFEPLRLSYLKFLIFIVPEDDTTLIKLRQKCSKPAV